MPRKISNTLKPWRSLQRVCKAKLPGVSTVNSLRTDFKGDVQKGTCYWKQLILSGQFLTRCVKQEVQEQRNKGTGVPWVASRNVLKNAFSQHHSFPDIGVSVMNPGA